MAAIDEIPNDEASSSEAATDLASESEVVIYEALKPEAGNADGTTPVLEAQGLAVGYHSRSSERVVARDLDLSLEAGHLVCLLGPNGVGKSTLLRTLTGIQAPLGGRVDLMGDDLHHLSTSARARRVSVVLTEPIVPGLLTAADLVALGRHPHTGWSGTLSDDDRAAVARCLEQVSAAHLAARAVEELSDGERQKILVARALAQEPRLMVLDEPTSHLDLPGRVEMMSLLRRLTREHQCSVLVATHHLDLALRTADRLWLLGTGGTIEQGAPEDLALDGALVRAFAGRGLVFDEASGDLRIVDELPRRSVRLVATGSERNWTEHALARAGFAVDDTSNDEVRLMSVAGVRRWSWRMGDLAGEAGSLGELVFQIGRRVDLAPDEEGRRALRG